jgi:hypothetical protein
MQLPAVDHAAAAMGLCPSGQDYDQMQCGTSCNHFGNDFNGEYRGIAVAPAN